MLGNFQTIRLLLVIFLDILIIIFGWNIYKYLGKGELVITIFGLLAFSYFYVGLSITYFSATFIFLIYSIYVLKCKNLNAESFFIVGALVSFFDLLTTPILTIGVPLIIYLLKIDENEIDIKKFFRFIISWFFGYLSIWVTKWIIADIFFDKNIILDALDAVKIRTNGSFFDIFKVIWKNLEKVKFEFLITIIILNFALKHYYNQYLNLKYKKKKLILLGVVSCITFVWYIFTQNHSIEHARYVYRDLFITFLGINSISYIILENKYKKML